MVPAAEQNDDLRWFLLRSKIHEENIKKVFEIFRENGIEPILIKGWAAAQNYPNPAERFYIDVDLCVPPEQFSAARALARQDKVAKLNIDLHCGLRFLDPLSWEDLFANSRIQKIDDSEIRVLRPEDHLRVLCVHWLHDGGADKEKLKDIFFAVENRGKDFDWSRCLDSAGEKRRMWIACTLGLAAKYLGLDVSGTPVENEAHRLPKWLTAAVEKEWKSGVRLKYLHTRLDNRAEFFEQIRKRIPPNPIQSTVKLEGSFHGNSRILYQIGGIFVRIIPSIKRITTVLLRRGVEKDR